MVARVAGLLVLRGETEMQPRAYVSVPRAGNGRKAAMMTSTRRDGARNDLPELRGWSPGLGFAGSDYGDRDRITGRARSLDENNGWINGGLDRRVESVIGGNIRLSAQPVHELLNRDYDWRMAWTGDVQARHRVWANDVEHRNDAKRRLSFGAQAKLAYLTYVRDGETAAEIRDNARGLANTTNVLLVEHERISSPPDKMEGPNFRGGIEYDDDGGAVAYWVRSGHPNDPTPGNHIMRWDRIPAQGPTRRAKFVHVFSPRRAEQNRGISRLAETILPAKMIDRVDKAEVNAALKSAIFSFFIKSPGTTEDIEAALAPANDKGGSDGIEPWMEAYVDYRNRNPVHVDGAQVVHLFPDEEVEAPARTSPNSNYPDFIRFLLQKVAASLGISYPQLSQDWAGINYSSARAMLNELWRSFLEDRHYFTQHFLTPIYAAWLEMEIALGTVKIPGGPINFYRNKTAITMAEWIGPGRGSVDPLKEANANNLDTAAGRKSTVECILESGRDPSDVLAEEVWYQRERKKRGLSEVNHDIKASGNEGDDATGGGSADDRDGDGIANEQEKQKRKGKE